MDLLLTRALSQVNEEFPALGIRNLSIVGRGSVFIVLRGDTRDGLSVGVRVAPEHWIEDEAPSHVNSHDLLTQECLMSTHCRAHGIPAPKVLGQSFQAANKDGLDLFVYEWLNDDQQPPEPYHMGEMLRRIHTMNPPAYEPVAMRGRSLERLLTDRILGAAGTITRLCNRPFTLPKPDSLRAHLSWPDKETSLLHMDFQPANLHAEKGEISGVTGWCNALIGPPTLELVRLDEIDVLDDSFLGGYANYEMFKAPKPVETAFRLDTATRHAVTLLHETPSATETHKAINRAAFLFDEFAQLSRS